MPGATVIRTIDAPSDEVFRTVARIEQFSQAIPHIVKIEFLSDEKSGVGTRFRETRVMKGKAVSTELEITECVDKKLVRIVSDSYGTVWDTVFTVSPTSNGLTELKMVMEARAHKLMARLMNPFVMSAIRSALEADMDAVKAYCED